MAFSVMSRVFKGDLTYTDAAKELDLPAPTVWHCFTNHWKVEYEDEKIIIKLKEAEESGDYLIILKTLVMRFEARVLEALKLPIAAYNERAVTSLSGELRALMRDILEYECKIQTGAFVQLTIIQTQMTKLTGFLLSTLCADDRQRLAKFLEELQAAEHIEPPRTTR